MTSTYDLVVVGEPYPDPALVLEEGIGWHTDGTHHSIVAAMHDPTPQEIHGLTVDYALAFCEFDGVLFPLLNPGDGWWIECAWAPLTVGDGDYHVPDPATGGHQLITQVIVNSRTGLVVNNRLFTLSSHATHALHVVVAGLLNRPYLTPDQFAATVDAVRQRFPRSEDMLPHVFVRTRTGQ